MPLMPVSLDRLDEIGMEAVSAMFAAELKKCVADLVDRPGNAKARKVILQFELTPRLNEHGIADSAYGRIKCASKLPAQHTREYVFAAAANGMLAIRPDATDAPEQSTFRDIQNESEGGDE